MFYEDRVPVDRVYADKFGVSFKEYSRRFKKVWRTYRSTTSGIKDTIVDSYLSWDDFLESPESHAASYFKFEEPLKGSQSGKLIPQVTFQSSAELDSLMSELFG